eukprot:6310055-Heterocapsa_arctica.AAC.1
MIEAFTASLNSRKAEYAAEGSPAFTLDIMSGPTTPRLYRQRRCKQPWSWPPLRTQPCGRLPRSPPCSRPA